MAKPPLAQRVTGKNPGARRLLKKALANPGLRSKLTDAQLKQHAPQMYAQRQANQQRQRVTQRQQQARQAQLKPIVAGSPVTERDLAKEAEAASAVQFGPKAAALREDLGVAQTRARDTGGFYDQYISQLATNRQRVADQQQATQAQLGQVASGITGLAGQEGAALQQQANQRAAAQGVAQAGDLSQLASGAAATRQALVGSFQAQQALQGAAANQYAGALENVVAPGQKLAAQAQGQGKIERARRDITDLAGQRGAWNQQYRTQRRGEEAKTVLARETLNLGTAKAAAQATGAAAARSETARHNRAGETNARNAAQAGRDAAAGKINQYGYTDADWRALSTDARRRIINKPTSSRDGESVYTSGAFAGKTKSEVNAMSPTRRSQVVTAYGKKPPLRPSSTSYDQDFRRKYGVKPASTESVNKGKSTISEAKVWLGRIGGNLDQAGQLLTTGQAKTDESVAIPKLPAVFVRAAMDMRRMNGYISAGTADRLHRSGYSVQQLGLKTRPAGRRPDTAGNPKVSR